jgi:anti-anti-sigma factor
MLNIKKNGEGEKLTIELGGRLDTTTSPLLEKEYADCLNGVTELAFDFSELEYISSAGLRVLLAAQKIMNKQGSMVIRSASDEIKEIFDVTGFSDILTLED